MTALSPPTPAEPMAFTKREFAHGAIAAWLYAMLSTWLPWFWGTDAEDALAVDQSG